MQLLCGWKHGHVVAAVLSRAQFWKELIIGLFSCKTPVFSSDTMQSPRHTIIVKGENYCKTASAEKHTVWKKPWFCDQFIFRQCGGTRWRTTGPTTASTASASTRASRPSPSRPCTSASSASPRSGKAGGVSELWATISELWITNIFFFSLYWSLKPYVFQCWGTKFIQFGPRFCYDLDLALTWLINWLKIVKSLIYTF